MVLAWRLLLLDGMPGLLSLRCLIAGKIVVAVSSIAATAVAFVLMVLLLAGAVAALV